LIVAILLPAALAAITVACIPEENPANKTTKKTPVSNINSLCYVCHVDLREEKITTVHLEQEITCANCHGPSTKHMQDEMLMTKPDILFGRDEVEPMCRQCHGPHKNPRVVQAFRQHWLGRSRPNGRP